MRHFQPGCRTRGASPAVRNLLRPGDHLGFEIVARHELKPHSLRQVVGDSFFYADALFNAGGTQPPPPSLLSTIKLREAGFAECVDTERHAAPLVC